MNAQVDETKINRMEQAAANLGKSLLEMLLGEIRALPDSWQVLSELQQQESLDRMCAQLDVAVDKAIVILAAGEAATIKVQVDKVVFQDGDVTAAVTVRSDSPYRHDLADAAGADVLILLSDVRDFTQSARGVKPEPDQPELKTVDGKELGIEYKPDDQGEQL